MKRGEIWWVCSNTHTGGELPKMRQAVIISNDAANRHLNRVQLIPLSKSTGKVYPSEAIVRVKGKSHRAMADQIITDSKRRLTNFMGALSDEDIRKVETALRIHLGLS